jgi:hypothetical protein
MSKCRNATKLAGLAAALLALASGRAAAQTAPPPWNLSGSDTLELIMKDSISLAERTPNGAGGTFLTPGQLVYVGGGSGTAETAMSNNVQSIGAMSRNLGSAVLTAHPTWAAGVPNVIALDAAVIVTRNSAGRIKNISTPDAPNTAQNTRVAVPNVASAYTEGVPGSGYTQLLQVILSGVDGSGSVAACADPRRVQAVTDFAALNNVVTIEHFYRRDDNSGTTNVFQDKLNVGRFCNGRARGVLGTVSTTNPNLNNQDLDPIRRPCRSPGTRPATTCTNVSTGAFCAAADNAATPGCEATNTCPCTQGLVVALSGGDNATTLVDVTTTIADRVAADSAGQTFGYAGREAARQPGAPTNAPFINTTSYGDGVVRLDGYLLSRRLYLQRGADITSGGTGGGGAPRVAAEAALFNFMTDPDGTSNPDGSQGRCNIEAIVKQHGFITCTSSCGTNPTGNNLCAKAPFPAALSTLANCLPNSATGGPAWNFGAVTNTGTTNQVCCSDGSTVVPGGTCPAANAGRARLASCDSNGQCASGLCIDVLGNGSLQCN